MLRSHRKTTYPIFPIKTGNKSAFICVYLLFIFYTFANLFFGNPLIQIVLLSQTNWDCAEDADARGSNYPYQFAVVSEDTQTKQFAQFIFYSQKSWYSENL